MKKRFEYIHKHLVKGDDGKWSEQETTYRVTITDKDDPRDGWKKGCAADYFTDLIRKTYGGKQCIHSNMIHEI